MRLKRFFELGLILAFGVTIGLALPSCPVFAQADIQSDSLDQTLVIKENGQVFQDGKRFRQARWDILASKHVFRYKAINRPGYSIGQAVVTIKLPATVTADDLNPQIFAIHGVEQSTIEAVDQSTLVARLRGMASTAEVSITIDFPPDAITFNSWYSFEVWVESLSFRQWLALAMIMPGLIGLYLLGLFISRWSDVFLRPVGTEQKTPPSNLPPGLVGVLIRGYVGPREIAATLIDLAHRGYIDLIYKGEGEYGFSQKRIWQNDKQLQDYERCILDQIFNETVVSTSQEITTKLNAHVWSESISQAIERMYGSMERLGYFQNSPKESHLSIRLAGMLIFFFSAIGLAMSFFFFTEQLVVTIPWLVSLAVAPFMTRFALLVPPRTAAGRVQAQQWLAFGSYLSYPTQAHYYEEQADYEPFLAYAVALGVERQWTARYATLPSRVPTWFYSQGASIHSYDQLASLLFELLGFVSQKFSFSRKPTTV